MCAHSTIELVLAMSRHISVATTPVVVLAGPLVESDIIKSPLPSCLGWSGGGDTGWTNLLAGWLPSSTSHRECACLRLVRAHLCTYLYENSVGGQVLSYEHKFQIS